MNSTSSPKSDEPVATLTLRKVKPGLEERFEAALHEFIMNSFDTEGQLGVHVIRPAPGSGSREYGVVRRFSSSQSRDRFYRSNLFKQWEQTVAQLTEGGPVRQEMSGLETWFTLPGQHSIIPPPRWKMAVVTLLGVWPVSIVVPKVLNPLIGNLNQLLQALFIAAGIVVLLTWVVMPSLVRILRPWLQQHR